MTDNPLPPLYSGGCHCGAVRFEVRADLAHVISCNCSICSTKGLMFAFAPADQFTLQSGKDKLSEYRFNKHVIGHMSCTTCGVEPFAQAIGPGGTPMVALNVRCLDDVDVSTLKPAQHDGRSA
ncbi:MAG TPA: GFA family protein [Ancylobacter sp.]